MSYIDFSNIYVPDYKILKNFADVLIKFALNNGQGIKKGEVVYVIMNEYGKPMWLPIEKSILESGGNMILSFNPAELERDRDQSKQFYEVANEDQLKFFPDEYIKARVNTVDHFVLLLSTHDHEYYKDIDGTKLATRNKVWKKYMEYRNEKEYAGKLTWVLTDYPTPAMANAANMTLEEYWDQIIKACFLDEQDPILKNRLVMQKTKEIVEWLNSLKIKKLRVTGADVDLHIYLTTEHQFVGGSGRNIPSFEVFTSPDTTKTEGWIYFNQPLYRNGQIIRGIKLEFKDGEVINYYAEYNNEALKTMLETDEGSKRVGEFSLTDKRFSRIDRIMANTLFDENFGGEYGNTHIALGQSYRDAIKNQEKYSNEEIKQFGFNDSAIHVDIISTSNRVVHAELYDGRIIKIYENGEFLI